MHRVAPRRILVAAALLAGLVVPATGVTAQSTDGPLFRDGHGLRVVSSKQLDARDLNVRVLSENLGRPVDVRILLPAGYQRHPARHYPVLYLFHGTSGRASDWPTGGHAGETTAPYPVITVMPDCGFDGDGGFWFTDWVDRTTSHGPSQFESYLIDQLIPWIDSSLRTIPARQGRAVAGLSQGGYGAAAMAARHPDLFSIMGSFSGAPEIDRDPDVIVGATGVIEAIAVGQDGVPPGSMFGSRATNEVNWQGHDPSTLMTNLRGMGIWLWTGVGAPGPYDESPDAGATGIEFLVHQSTKYFHEHLVDEGIAHHYDDYTYGTHSWPYWARDLRKFMKPMMTTFAHPRTPKTISYMSIDKRWSQWGWAVSFHRDADQQFSFLEHANARGFTLRGNGQATVTTAPYYAPGEPLRMTLHYPPDREVTGHVTADATGRVTLRLALSDGAMPSGNRVELRPERPSR
jgi:S-formylglutathione hydrolase FrmB